MSLRIPYQTESFSQGLPNGEFVLETTWDDLLWAALTVGRPSRQAVVQHGNSSFYEAIFRCSLLRMAIEARGSTGFLFRTSAARTLDPSEKGAVSYFLGMTLCKLFASELLQIPWLLHLDVYRPFLDVVLSSRSRPDLIGHMANDSARWSAFESKGRVSPPDEESKLAARDQARRVRSVVGRQCELRIGSITYFRDDQLRFYWRDPPESKDADISVELGDASWESYYSGVWGIVDQNDGWTAPMQTSRVASIPVMVYFAECDLAVHIHSGIAKYLADRDWNGAHDAAVEKSAELVSLGFKPDGTLVVAGPSWIGKRQQAELA